MILGAALLSGCGTPHEVDARGKEERSYIGTAEMKTDGTIILQLRAELPNGFGEGYFVYPPPHPGYQNILKHIAPLEPGQSTRVRPWPENKTEPTSGYRQCGSSSP